MNDSSKKYIDDTNDSAVYDEPGICPKCGNPMRAVHLYCADTFTMNMGTTSNYYGGRWVKTTKYATSYSNIRPHLAGVCDVCVREEQERKQSKIGQTPPDPAKWIIGAILTVYGIVFIVRSIILNESEVGLLLASAFIAFIVGLWLFCKNIGKYSKARRLHLRYKAGGRDYTTVSASTAALILTIRHKDSKTEYMTEEQLHELAKKQNPGYPWMR